MDVVSVVQTHMQAHIQVSTIVPKKKCHYADKLFRPVMLLILFFIIMCAL